MVTADFTFESQLWNTGKNLICGIDEVGRGCFAGPVVVGAVIFPKDSFVIEGIADSKLLSASKREQLAVRIKNEALCWAVAEVGVPIINKLGIGKATQVAFRKVVTLLTSRPDFILIDAFYINHFDKKIQKPIVHGDALCASIAAASIVAKVYRDNLMRGLDKKYPQYGFLNHKGYGTKAHRDAIKEFGLSKIHRKSFDLAKFL